jgi:hypothetical protein
MEILKHHSSEKVIAKTRNRYQHAMMRDGSLFSTTNVI